MDKSQYNLLPTDSQYMKIERPKKKSANILHIVLGLLFFFFTLLSYDDQYARWWYLSIVMGFSVLALQFTNLVLLRVYALWFGFFIVAESVFSVFYVNHNFLTLLPKQDYTLDATSVLFGIEGVQHITTDEKGFRTTKPISYHQDSPLRVYAIGASTTEQMNLDDRHMFTHLLQEDMQDELSLDVEVVNTGVSGLRTINHIATFEHIIDLYPDLVIVLLGVNDWNRHILLNYPEDLPENFSKQEYPGWQKGIRLRNTLLGQVIVGMQMQFIANEYAKENVLDIYMPEANSLNRARAHTFKPPDVSKEYKNHLSMLFDLCTKQSIPCVMMTQPNAYKETATEDIKRMFWMTPPYAEYTLDFDSMIYVAKLYNDYLITKAKEENIPLCNIDEKMAPSFDSFYDDVHFNIAGARRVADILLPCVLDVIKRVDIVARR